MEEKVKELEARVSYLENVISLIKDNLNDINSFDTEQQKINEMVLNIIKSNHKKK
jgi:prefoldin subunit 5